MPDILIRITGQNSASAAIQQASSSLSALERAMAGVSSGGSRVESALRRAASAQSSLVSAMNAVSTAQSRVTSEGNRAALALENYTRLSDRLNNASGDTSRLQDQVQRAFAQSTTAADRYAESLTRLSNANATLGQRQAKVATTTKNLNEPPPPAEPKSGGGLFASAGGALKNTLLYGGVYAGGYALASAGEQSLSRNAQYSRLLGTTQGFTGGSAADTTEINRYVQGLAGTGTLPYSPLQLLTSYYGLASADIYGGTKTTERIATRNAQVAAASGDVDPTGTNQAILAMIGAYNQNGPNVASFANTDLNQLTAGVIKGQLTFADFASVIPRAKASIGKAAGVSGSDLIAYLSAESNVGISADQGAKDFGSLVQQLVAPNRVQQAAAKRGHIDLSSGFLQRDGGLSGFLNILQTSTAGLTEPQRATFLAKLLDNKAAGGGLAAVLGDTKNQGIFPYVANANANGGAAQAAINAYNATPGAKLANAEAQFNTALDNLTKTTLPAFTLAVQSAATVLADVPSIIANWGKVTPGNPAGGNPFQTYGYLLLDAVKGKGFDIGLARNQAATGGFSTGYEYQYATDPSKFLAQTKNIWSGANGANAFFAQFPNLATPFGYTAHPLTQEQVTQNGKAVPYGQYSAVESRLPKLGANQYYTSGPSGNLIVKTFANNGVLGYNYTSGTAGAKQGIVPSLAIPGAPTAASALDAARTIMSGLMTGGGILAAGAAGAAAAGYRVTAADVTALSGSPSSAAARTTAARTARFINAPGVGALEAGAGSTAVRFAGQLDPEATELRQLRQENSLLRGIIAADNTKIIGYLATIAGQGKHIQSYPPNKVVSNGGGRSYKG